MKIEIVNPIKIELLNSGIQDEKNQSDDVSKENPAIFQSASVIYEIAKDEYQQEINRTSILDTKIGIMLPIVSTYFFSL